MRLYVLLVVVLGICLNVVKKYVFGIIQFENIWANP